MCLRLGSPSSHTSPELGKGLAEPTWHAKLSASGPSSSPTQSAGGGRESLILLPPLFKQPLSGALGGGLSSGCQLRTGEFLQIWGVLGGQEVNAPQPPSKAALSFGGRDLCRLVLSWSAGGGPSRPHWRLAALPRASRWEERPGGGPGPTQLPYRAPARALSHCPWSVPHAQVRLAPLLLGGSITGLLSGSLHRLCPLTLGAGAGWLGAQAAPLESIRSLALREFNYCQLMMINSQLRASKG